MNQMRTTLLSAAVAGVLAVGCSSSRQTTKLTPGSFAQTRPAAMPAALASKAPILADSTPSSPAILQNQAASAATKPANGGSRPVVSMGNFMIVGTVLAEANGKPIYADKVLAKLDGVLSLKAKELSPAQFANFAYTMILQQVDTDIKDELEFAAAQRFTSDEDQQIANAYTIMWRQKEITKNGGSLAVTQDRYLNPVDASTPPQDFDQAVKDQYRKNLTLIYYQRKIWPRVSVTVEEMREYYNAHKEELYSVKSGVLFRAIQIDVSASGNSRQLAQQRIEAAMEKVKKGEDFGLIATSTNDNRAWRSSGGYVVMAEKTDAEGNVYMRHEDGRVILKDKEGFGVIKSADDQVLQRSKELLEGCKPIQVPQHINPGTLAAKALEEAVFKLEKVGDVTTVIDGGNSFYIATLEDKRNASEKSFDLQEVQQDIRKRLEAEQYKILREKEQLKLMKEAVYRMDEKMIKSAVDMALQKYTLQNSK